MKLYIPKKRSTVKMKARLPLWRGKSDSMVQFHETTDFGPLDFIHANFRVEWYPVREREHWPIQREQPNSPRTYFPGAKEAVARATDQAVVAVHQKSEAIAKVWTLAVGQMIADGKGGDILQLLGNLDMGSSERVL
jgi:hypothetical protein